MVAACGRKGGIGGRGMIGRERGKPIRRMGRVVALWIHPYCLHHQCHVKITVKNIYPALTCISAKHFWRRKGSLPIIKQTIKWIVPNDTDCTRDNPSADRTMNPRNTAFYSSLWYAVISMHCAVICAELNGTRDTTGTCGHCHIMAIRCLGAS